MSMEIHLSNLKEGQYHYQFQFNEIKNEKLNDIHDILIHAMLEKIREDFFLTLKVEFSYSIDCARCLVPVNGKENADFHVTYTRPSTPDEIDSDDYRVLRPDTHIIDISEDVIDTINLATPMKITCREDCKGLCPTCGVNLNEETCECTNEEIDPRWADLLKFKKN